jgi:putative DNA primase/helicase
VSTHSEPVLVNLADIQPEQVRWLWQDCVPFGKVTIFAGDPGLGKSLVALDLAARVTRGGRGVILLSAEDDPADTIRPRLDAAGADVRRIQLLTAVRVPESNGKQAQRMLRLDRDIEQIAEAVRQNPDTDLVTIDPLSAYMGGVDANSDEQVRSILAPLAELAARTQVAIVSIKHLNKAEEKSAMYRAGGSIGFVAAARIVWMFGKDRDEPERRLMVLAKSNISANPGGRAYRIEQTESGNCCVIWESEPVQIAIEDFLRPVVRDEEPALDAAKEWLQQLLSTGPVAAKEVEQAVGDSGLHWMTVRRAADALKIERTHEGFGSGSRWMWSLPKMLTSVVSRNEHL